TNEQRKVLSIRPGITDIASLRYKDENDILGKVDNPEEHYVDVIMQDKLSLNLEYIEKNNVIFDIGLILKTIMKCIE
ncbi:MAG: sugar transferase, partial [Bacteroidales bacterium]